ncbi:MAG: type II toxin-antitoxin system VapC family toxin [Verrucomicrobia bacterium]|nr:type II toxin-antitoxin system VapC family toxin [Verrucomicrobiota bacterium]
MTPYADTNFFTRWYLELPESHLVHQLAADAERHGAPALPVSWLHRMELCNALQLHVFQSRTPVAKRVTPEQAAAALALFREDQNRREMLRTVSVLIADLEGQLEELSLRHTAKHGFRIYDLLHVSSALLLRCDTFWSFDQKANKLAKLEGLKTILLGVGS